MQSRHVKDQGMNWIRKEKRLAIYLRDGLACVYCGQSVEDGVQLTLDHLICYKHRGTNHESNLVTACLQCNSSRGARPWKLFAKKVAGYINHGVTAKQIVSFISKTIARPLDVKAAQKLIARRGGFVKAVYGKR